MTVSCIDHNWNIAAGTIEGVWVGGGGRRKQIKFCVFTMMIDNPSGWRLLEK